MASKEFIVESLLDECGKDSPAVRSEFSRAVGKITVELLSQNDGRFFGLKKTTTLSITTTDRQYKLPADFNTISRDSAELDSDDEYVQDVHVLTKSEIRERLREEMNVDCHYGYIEKLDAGPEGRGYYLTLAVLASSSRTFEIEYYRRPTENDTDVITEHTLIERGVRAQFPDYFESAEVDRTIYLNRLPKFFERTRRVVTQERILPPRRVQKRNEAMHKFGRGL